MIAISTLALTGTGAAASGTSRRQASIAIVTRSESSACSPGVRPAMHASIARLSGISRLAGPEAWMPVTVYVAPSFSPLRSSRFAGSDIAPSEEAIVSVPDSSPS
jgi:hypothetical protein